jgi:hypothetical protein
MANLDMDNLDTDNTEIKFNLEKLQSPDARITLKRVYVEADLAKTGMPFDAYVAWIETMSGVKIPELQ